MSTTAENKEIVRRDIAEVWNQGDVETIPELYADEAVFHYPGQPPMDPEAVAGFVSGFRSAVPDLDVHIEDLVAEDDRVLCRFTESGTHEGELMGVPATGESFETTGMILYRIGDGEITEAWVNDDALGMLQQIGALPAVGSAPATDGGREPYLLADDGGTPIWSFGALMNLKATGDDTGGAFALVDHLADPGVESPYHVHHNEEETFYVLDGEIDCFYGMEGEERIRAGPGDTVYLPRDVPHGFRVVSDDPCRMLVLVAPAGIEGLWIEAGEIAPELTTPPPPEEPPDLEALAPLFDQYDLEVLGPIPD